MPCPTVALSYRSAAADDRTETGDLCLPGLSPTAVTTGGGPLPGRG